VILLTLLLACGPSPPVEATPPVEAECGTVKNTCADYAPYWNTAACPDGSRCITFTNACDEPVVLAYQIGCNSDGTKGAPQCDCTPGPTLGPGDSAYWQIVDGNYPSCPPSWEPPCLTSGLAVLANVGGAATCATGTRLEYTAGNAGDPYGKFDSYNIDVEKDWYSVAVTYAPDLTCANDHANHDCRPLFCDKADCPDAYQTPTTGGCPDGRSPQASCQDTFNGSKGYTVTFCPTGGKSCQDAQACP
jgi:hypothetical protein